MTANETFEQIIARGTAAIGFEETLYCFYFPAINSETLDDFLEQGKTKLAWKIKERGRAALEAKP